MNCDIEIDGSIGGGSVLRVAVPLALGLKKSIRIINIRANRNKPGLRQQHLLSLKALTEITGSKLVGGTVGSTTIDFIPPQRFENKTQININIPTAAAVSLIIQALSNYALVSKQEIKIDFEGGGTHTNWSPNLDYVKRVTTPILSKFGQLIDVNLDKYGFYPKGGSKGSIRIRNRPIKSVVTLESSSLDNIEIILLASKNLENANVLERQLDQLKASFGSKYLITSKLRYEGTLNTGTSVTVVLNYTSSIPKGISKLGERGTTSEKIALMVFEECKDAISNASAVDEYMADQLIVPLAFCPSGSTITIPRVSKHTKVNLDLVNLILGDCLKIQEYNGFVRLTRM